MAVQFQECHLAQAWLRPWQSLRPSFLASPSLPNLRKPGLPSQPPSGLCSAATVHRRPVRELANLSWVAYSNTPHHGTQSALAKDTDALSLDPDDRRLVLLLINRSLPNSRTFRATGSPLPALPWTYLCPSGFSLLLWLRGDFSLHWGPSLAFPISCPLGLCLGPLSRLHHPGPPPLPCVCSASSAALPKPLGQPQNPPHAPPNALLGLLSRPMCTLPASPLHP